MKIHFKADILAAVAVVDAKAPYTPRVRESKTVLDYKSHSMDSIFQSFSVELGGTSLALFTEMKKEKTICDYR